MHFDTVPTAMNVSTVFYNFYYYSCKFYGLVLSMYCRFCYYYNQSDACNYSSFIIKNYQSKIMTDKHEKKEDRKNRITRTMRYKNNSLIRVLEDEIR